MNNLINKEKDLFLILNTGKCSWGKCLFCGWGRLEFPKKSVDELIKEFIEKYEKLEKKENNIDRIKLYCSGSFLDEEQVPFEFLVELLNYLKDKNVKKLLLETRINDLKEEKLKRLKELAEKANKEIWFGIGLEVADNFLIKALMKDFFDLESFKEKALKAKELGFKLRVYALVNVPYDKNVVETTKKTFEFAREIADEVVFINAYPHKDAPIFWLWFNKRWKPLNKEEFIKVIKKALNIDEKIIDELIKGEKQFVIENTKIELDYSNYYFIPKFPEQIIKEYKEKYLKGAKIENLKNRVYEMWEEFLLNFYEPPKEKDILFLIPCAARKPYFLSKTHKLLKKTVGGFQLYKKMHWVVVSNPGVIPYEFITKFPFKDYDWPEWEETREIQEEYFKTTKERVKNYLKKHGGYYKLIISFFKPDSLTAKAIEEAIKELSLEKKYIKTPDIEIYEEVKKEVKKPLFDKRILNSLKEKLKEIQKDLKNKDIIY
jgi:archaeosine synthase